MFDSRDFRNLTNRQGLLMRYFLVLFATSWNAWDGVLGNQLEKLFHDTRYWTNFPKISPRVVVSFKRDLNGRKWKHSSNQWSFFSLQVLPKISFSISSPFSWSINLNLHSTVRIFHQIPIQWRPVFGFRSFFTCSPALSSGHSCWTEAKGPWDVASREISNESIWWLQAVDYDLNGLSPIDTVANQQELCGPIAKHHRFVVLLYRSTCPQMILTSHSESLRVVWCRLYFLIVFLIIHKHTQFQYMFLL